MAGFGEDIEMKTMDKPIEKMPIENLKYASWDTEDIIYEHKKLIKANVPNFSTINYISDILYGRGVDVSDNLEKYLYSDNTIGDTQMRETPQYHSQYLSWDTGDLIDEYLNINREDFPEKERVNYIQKLPKERGIDPSNPPEGYLFCDYNIGDSPIYTDSRGDRLIWIQGSRRSLQPEQSTTPRPEVVSVVEPVVTSDDIELSYEEQDELRRRLESLSNDTRNLTERKIEKIIIIRTIF